MQNSDQIPQYLNTRLQALQTSFPSLHLFPLYHSSPPSPSPSPSPSLSHSPQHISLSTPLCTSLLSPSLPLCPVHWHPSVCLCKSCSLLCCLDCLQDHSSHDLQNPWISQSALSSEIASLQEFCGRSALDLEEYLELLQIVKNKENKLEIEIEVTEVKIMMVKIAWAFKEIGKLGMDILWEGMDWEKVERVKEKLDWERWKGERERMVNFLYAMERCVVRPKDVSEFWWREEIEIWGVKVQVEMVNDEQEWISKVRWRVLGGERYLWVVEGVYKIKKKVRVIRMNSAVVGSGDVAEVDGFPYIFNWNTFMKKSKFWWMISIWKPNARLEKIRDIIKSKKEKFLRPAIVELKEILNLSQNQIKYEN